MRSVPYLLVVLLAACGHPDSADLKQLQAFEGADDRVVATATVSCDAADPVCARLWLEQGAACARFTEARSGTERAAMRSCAVQAFQQAVVLTPRNASAGDRLDATRGLANALKIARDNAAMGSDARQRAERNLDAILPRLAALPGGTPYRDYFAADAALNRALVGKTSDKRICLDLQQAAGSLPTTGMPAELSARVAELRRLIDAKMQHRSCA